MHWMQAQVLGAGLQIYIGPIILYYLEDRQNKHYKGPGQVKQSTSYSSDLMWIQFPGFPPTLFSTPNISQEEQRATMVYLQHS